MKLSYEDLKLMIYIVLTVLGVSLLIVSWSLTHNKAEADPSYLLSAMVLFVIGSICVLFGVTTFILRNDPDIWR